MEEEESSPWLSPCQSESDFQPVKTSQNRWMSKEKLDCLCIVKGHYPRSNRDNPSETHFLPDETPHTRLRPYLVPLHLRVIRPITPVFFAFWELWEPVRWLSKKLYVWWSSVFPATRSTCCELTVMSWTRCFTFRVTESASKSNIH